MKGKRINQINNLVIYQDTDEKINYFGTIIENPNFGKCSVWKKDGSACLETRLSLEQAEDFCKNTKDFIQQNLPSVDDLISRATAISEQSRGLAEDLSKFRDGLEIE